MEQKKPSEFPQEVRNLFDRFVRGGISRREFIDKAAKFAVGGMTSTLMFESLWATAKGAPRAAGKRPAGKASYDGLKKTLRGQVILPGDADYEQLRWGWNRDVDRRPAAIARCVDESDVQAAVRFAKEAGIEDVAVRGGGHSYAGLSTCDNGLIIDLGLMRKTRAGDNNRIFVQGGAHLSDMNELTSQMGTAVPAGVEPGTGVAGLSLGGGVGNLQRRFGLTCDNLRSVRMVTAEGKIVVANDKTDHELMWGMRGAGWNFGIVTEFEFESHPVNPSFSSLFFVFPLDIQEDFAKFFDGFVQDLPKDVSMIMMSPRLSPQAIRGVASAEGMPAGAPAGNFFGVNALWVGSPDGADNVFKPLLQWKPVAKTATPTTFAKLSGIGAPPQAPQNRYVRGGYVNGVDTGILKFCGKMIDKGAPPGMAFVFSTMGGAIKEIGEKDSAFSGRSAKYFYALEVSWKEPSQREPTLAFVRETYDGMEKFATGGEYTNTVTDEGTPDKQGLRGIPPREERVRQVYGEEKFARLQRLKSHWDPKNLFHVNINVAPEKAKTSRS